MSGAVAVKSCESYSQSEVDAAVEELFRLCAPPLDPKGGRARALLKVNLLMRARPDEAVTTHPAVVTAVIRALRARGFSDITIADSPSGPASEARLRGIYDATGMSGVAEKEGASLCFDLASSRVKGRRGREFDVLDIVQRSGVVINIAKLKTHAMTGFTCAVKNCFGVVPGLDKSEKHLEYPDRDGFCEMLCELCDTVAPAFTVVDGVVGMEGNGPSGGSPRKAGIVAAGESPYLVDRVLCGYVGFTPDEALTVKRSTERGSAPRDMDEITVLGDADMLGSPVAFKRPETVNTDLTGYAPRLLRPLWTRFLRAVAPRPVVRTEDCVGCGRCAEICPQKTIEVSGGRARIHKDRCIRCFCCHEVCPERAVDIKRSFVFRALK